MANYHLAYKVGNAGFGGPHAEYITRSGKYSKGHKKEELQYKESGNIPQWGKENPVKFWQAADIFENVNGRSYREFEVSLPNELSVDENIKLMNEFKDKMLGKDFAYTYAIHKSYNSGQENTHAHFMFTERKNDGIEREPDAFFKRANFRYPNKGGAKKDRIWQKKEVLLNARKQFAAITNKHLEMAGFEDRVDHRSIKDQLKEALEKNDIDKVDYLTRPAVNISGNLLNKVERKLSILEKKSLSEFQEARQLKREKEKKYRAKTIPLEKKEILLEIKKIDQRLDENKLKKSTLNSITNGDYYKHLNRNFKLKKELKIDPANIDIKTKLDDLREKINDIEEYLPETSKYIKKYRALERAYSSKKEALIKELENRFDIKREDLAKHLKENSIDNIKSNIKTTKLRRTINLSSHFSIKDTLERIDYNIEHVSKDTPGEELKKLKLEKEALEKELSKTKLPDKETLETYNIEKLIRLREEYLTYKLNMENFKKKTTDISDSENRPRYSKLIYKSVMLEKLIESQEGTVKNIGKSKILEISLEYKRKEENKQGILKSGVEKLENLLKLEEILEKKALNKMTKGKYSYLEKQKIQLNNMICEFKEERRILENKLQLTSKIYFIQSGKLNKKINTLNSKIDPLEKKYNHLAKEQSKLYKSVDPKLLKDQVREVSNNIYRALNMTKMELFSSKSEIIICNDMQKSYRPLTRAYSVSHSKQKSRNLKKIGDLFQEDSKTNSTKQSMKPKIFKREDDKDVAELER